MPDLFTALVLSCILNSDAEPVSCTTYTFPSYQNTMEECLNVLMQGILAVEGSGAYAVDYRCIAWRKKGEDQPFNESDL